MGPEKEHDLTSHAARRRRVLAGVLAGAAVAIPGVAFAAGGESSSSTASPSGDAPAITIQEREQAPQERAPNGPDRRDCPEEQDGSGSGSDSGESSGGTSQETALL